MRLTGNASMPGSAVAPTRARETALLSNKSYCRNPEALGIQNLQYSEASPEKS